jgi:hypothetical protein
MWKINPLILAGAVWWWFRRPKEEAPPVGAPAEIPTGLGQRPPALQSAQVRLWPPFLTGGRSLSATLRMGPVLGQFCPCTATPRRVSYVGTPDPTLSLFVTSVRRGNVELLPAAARGGVPILSRGSGGFPLREDSSPVDSSDSIVVTLQNRDPAARRRIQLPQLSIDFEVHREECPTHRPEDAPRFLPPASLRRMQLRR